MKRIDKKYAFIFVGILFLSFVFLRFQQEAFDSIKLVITYEHFSSAIGLVLFLLTITHRIKYLNFRELKNLEFNELKTLLSDLGSALLDPATLVCSISLMKGLFLLKYYNIKYFDHFTEGEITFFWTAGIYFFFKSLLQMQNVFLELFVHAQEVAHEIEPKKIIS
jgi:hypothetical protein